MQAQLRPGAHLEQLLERARATGQREVRVGERGHPRLAFVQVGDHLQVGEPRVGDLPVDQALRDDAVDTRPPAASTASASTPIVPDARAAVDELDPALGERAPDLPAASW